MKIKYLLTVLCFITLTQHSISQPKLPPLIPGYRWWVVCSPNSILDNYMRYYVVMNGGKDTIRVGDISIIPLGSTSPDDKLYSCHGKERFGYCLGRLDEFYLDRYKKVKYKIDKDRKIKYDPDKMILLYYLNVISYLPGSYFDDDKHLHTR